VLAAVGGVIFVIFWRDTPAIGAIGVVMVGAIAFAASRRHRVGTAAASFVTAFGPWGFAYVLGAFYLALAFYLVAGRQVRHDRRGTRR
jgi:hypothetical protein